MYGAILGDMIGAPYEFDRGNQTKEFPLFSQRSVFTDDSILTVAVAEALLDSLGKTDEETRCAVTDSMRRWCRRYPYPSGGYGSRFRGWLFSDKPQPYGSCGNGAAMRVAAAGWLADTMEECHRLARLSAEVTHNHPQGIKGAQSVASVIFLARTGSSKPAIRRYIVQAFGYDLSRTCDQIRPGYSHRETCQETVPEAITAFLEGTDFEDVIRTAVSLGGDCDTLACIAGSMAEAFYGVPEPLKDECRRRLPEDLLAVVDHFWETVSLRAQDAAETVQGTVRAVRKMQSEAEEIWPGWEIVRPIGKGSFGNVYEIRKTENGAVQKAALKVISVPAEKAMFRLLMIQEMPVRRRWCLHILRAK